MMADAATGGARLFVAVEIPQSARAALELAVREARKTLPPARWVAPQRWHLTLHFLGQVETSQAPRIGEAVADVAASLDSPTLQLADAGTFPERRPARVAWIGVVGGDALTLFAGALGGALARDSPPGGEARVFHPHLTVARPGVPWPRNAAERFAALLAGSFGAPFEVTELVLMESRLRPSGPSYHALSRASLRLA